MICVSTMHHLEHYQFCIIVRFCFGTELHLYMHASAFRWIIQWFSAGRTNSTQFIQFCPVLVMSSSAVIVNMTWCGVWSDLVGFIEEAAWPSGQRVGLAIRRSWVRVPLWPLAWFVLGRPEFKFSATLVNSQLVASCQLGFLILLCCIWIICF